MDTHTHVLKKGNGKKEMVGLKLMKRGQEPKSLTTLPLLTAIHVPIAMSKQQKLQTQQTKAHKLHSNKLD